MRRFRLSARKGGSRSARRAHRPGGPAAHGHALVERAPRSHRFAQEACRMRTVIALLISAFVLALAAAVSTASRGFQPSISTLSASSRAVTISDSEGLATVICELSLTVSLHRTIAKARGTLVGFVTGATARNCSGGRVTVLTGTLPWHIQYDSFTGTLPRIETISTQILGAAFLGEAAGGLSRCLYAGAILIIRLILPEGNVLGILIGVLILPFVSTLGGFFCPEGVTIAGNLATTPAVTVRLI